MRKKLLSLALALCMLLGLLPTAAFAADIASGTCGGTSRDPKYQGDITWRLTGDGTLVLEGTGATARYNDRFAQLGPAPWDNYAAQIKKIYVGKGTTHLRSGLFYNCKKVAEIELEDGNQLEEIISLPLLFEKITALNGKNYFTYAGDVALYARNMDDNGNITDSEGGKLTLFDYPSTAALTSYTVKAGTEIIAATAFQLAKNLKEIVLPEGVTEIYLSAFEGCSALEKLDLPESLTTLDATAFWGCDALKTVVVPSSVTKFKNMLTPSDGLMTDPSQSKAFVFSEDAPAMDGWVISMACSSKEETSEYDGYSCWIKTCIYYPENASGWEELAEKYTNEDTEFIPYDPAVGPFPEEPVPPKPAVTPETVTIKNSDPVYVVQGDTKVLTVETDPAGGEVYWLSSDTSVVTVDRTTGKLTGVAPGSAQVTASAVLGTAADNVTVWVTKPSSGGSSGGGGGGSSSGGSSTETTRNPDGSVTKTVTNKRAGTVTVTTTAKDGTKTVVETTKDGSVTKTVTDPKGGKVTAVIKGGNTAAITLSGGKTQAVVELPVKAGVGTVAVIVHADGSEEVIKTTVPTEEGVKLLVDKNVTVQFKDKSKAFTDIPADSWARDAIDFVSARGIFKGTSESTFTPSQEIDRAMMATLLFRLAEGKAEGENTFADVPAGDWYTDPVIWANANGIVTGYDNGAFGPTDVVTREQMAVMFYRYAKLLGMDTTVKGDLGKFTDMAAASDWAAEAMAWCVGVGLMNGTSDTTLAPAGTASRAEVATMLMRMVELMVG